jgi:site-specific recombinase XerD
MRRLDRMAWQGEQRMPLRFHGLRHVFATWLNQQGIPMEVIGNLMGHRSLASTARYVTADRLAAGKVLQFLPLAQIGTKEPNTGGLLCQQTAGVGL